MHERPLISQLCLIRPCPPLIISWKAATIPVLGLYHDWNVDVSRTYKYIHNEHKHRYTESPIICRAGDVLCSILVGRRARCWWLRDFGGFPLNSLGIACPSAWVNSLRSESRHTVFVLYEYCTYCLFTADVYEKYVN